MNIFFLEYQMKKIISLIILSIILKGYFSDTENLCSEVNQNFETACPAAVTNDPKKNVRIHQEKLVQKLIKIVKKLQ